MLLLSSCATILNSPVQKIYISSGKDVKIVSVDKATYVDSAFKSKDAPKAYYVPRSNNPLKVTIQIDSIQKTLLLRPRNSLAFWANIYFNYGLGMLVDWKNVKRCRYRANNYFTEENGKIINKGTFLTLPKFIPAEKGMLNFSLSAPIMTNLVVNSPYGNYESSGMIGLSAGLNYYYSKKDYISADIGFGTDVLPLPIDYFGPHEQSDLVYANFRNNRVLGNIDIGYGINISKYYWYLIKESGQNSQSLSNVGIGGSFSADYRLTNYFRLGVLYQPNLLNNSFRPTIDYQHYFSLNLIWRTPLNKKAH